MFWLLTNTHCIEGFMSSLLPLLAIQIEACSGDCIPIIFEIRILSQVVRRSPVDHPSGWLNCNSGHIIHITLIIYTSASSCHKVVHFIKHTAILMDASIIISSIIPVLSFEGIRLLELFRVL